MNDAPTRMSKVIPKTLAILENSSEVDLALSSNTSANAAHHGVGSGPGISPRKTKLHVMGTSMQDLKINFFRTKSHKTDPQIRKKEDIGISVVSLRFTNEDMEKRFVVSRCTKYHTRLKFGAGFTAFFIPLLVIMQVSFKAKDNKEKWTQVPFVMIFPGTIDELLVVALITMIY